MSVNSFQAVWKCLLGTDSAFRAASCWTGLNLSPSFTDISPWVLVTVHQNLKVLSSFSYLNFFSFQLKGSLSHCQEPGGLPLSLLSYWTIFFGRVSIKMAGKTVRMQCLVPSCRLWSDKIPDVLQDSLKASSWRNFLCQVDFLWLRMKDIQLHRAMVMFSFSHLDNSYSAGKCGSHF